MTRDWNRSSVDWAALRRRCEVCGRDTTRDVGRCTNGRCADCHRRYCTAGGSTTPGHGRGQVPPCAPDADDASARRWQDDVRQANTRTDADVEDDHRGIDDDYPEGAE